MRTLKAIRADIKEARAARLAAFVGNSDDAMMIAAARLRALLAELHQAQAARL